MGLITKLLGCGTDASPDERLRFAGDIIFPQNRPITSVEARRNYRSHMSGIGFFRPEELTNKCRLFSANLQCASWETKENVKYRRQDLKESQRNLKECVNEYRADFTPKRLSNFLLRVKREAVNVAECEYNLDQAIKDCDDFANDKTQYLIEYINSEIHGYCWSLPAGTTVSFIYKSNSGEITARTVQNVVRGIGKFSGFCTLRNSERTFKTHKVLEFVASGSNLKSRLDWHLHAQQEEREKIEKRALEIFKETARLMGLNDGGVNLGQGDLFKEM